MGTVALLSGECVFFWFWDAVPRLMINSDEPLAMTQSPIHAIFLLFTPCSATACID